VQREEQRDVTILRSLPGVGRIVLATLVAEAQDALQRRNYHALRRADHEAIGKKQDRADAPGGARPAAQRRLPLGAHCRAARSPKPGQICRIARPRPWSRPCPTLRRRPPAGRRLRPCSNPKPPSTRASPRKSANPHPSCDFTNGGESPPHSVLRSEDLRESARGTGAQDKIDRWRRARSPPRPKRRRTSPPRSDFASSGRKGTD
jgi:hypothetical protein